MRGCLLPVLLTCAACGRETIINPGTEGGPCYGNRTCNEDLYCSGSEVCVRREPGDPGCTGADCAEPSDAVVLIEDFPGGSFWIDVYEASLVGINELGSGVQDQDYDGKIADAAVVAAHATSHGMLYDDDGGEEAVVLTEAVAASRVGELPALNLTYHQAAAACTNAGKRLCTGAEWTWACRGGTADDYPYGDDYDGSDDPGQDCWTHWVIDTPVPTGTARACRTATGIYDLSGNAWEYTDYRGIDWVEAHGGSVETFPSASTCGSDYSSWSHRWALDESGDTVGFRCCKAAPAP